ncbi:MAG: glycosyltransferase [Pseudomonadota bacterium]
MAGAETFKEPGRRARFETVGLLETEYASNVLADQAPLLSSRRLNGRLNWVWLVLFVFGLCVVIAPNLTMEAVSGTLLALFFSLIILRGALVMSSCLGQKRNRGTGHGLPPLRTWPTYTVLIPLFDEAASVPNLVAALNRLDYPMDKLEVIFLVEETDSETSQAVRQSQLPATWSILVLPDGVPRTKPRALNVGLGRARGNYLTIYDAEDRPHPAQLKAAVLEFEQEGAENVACIQAPLRAHNGVCSWVSGHWGLEYDVHFGLVVPALARSGLPIALGGTSNHFRVDVLKAVGGWDAWNVTEDADLGIRFARLGWKIGSISLPTLEEAPESLAVWTAQRSRWIKGYMQTWGVLMTRPLSVIPELGVREYIAIQLLLGGAILSACFHGPLIIWFLAGFAIPESAISGVSLSVIGLGYIVSAMSAFLAPGRGANRWLLVLTLPIYWPLLSIAALRAVIELFKSPYSWAKTPHGLTANTSSLDPAAFH